MAIVAGIVLAACTGTRPEMGQTNNNDEWRRTLLGEWFRDSWSNGKKEVFKEVFEPSGRGTYYRNGALCVEFSYEIHGNVLTMAPDNPNECIGTPASFQLTPSHYMLMETDERNGLVLSWVRTPPPRTSNICWIERVEKTSSGVNVHFTDTRRIVLHHAGESARVIMVRPDAADTDENARGQSSVRAVPAVLGDELFSSNVPEDSCVMKVVTKADAIGIEASASMHLPGTAAVSVSRFMAAEP